MRVVFSCYVYDFHKHYCTNIAEEVINRGGEVIYSKKGEIYNADFTIQPDEIYDRQGSRMGIWIDHAMPVIPQNGFFLGEKFKNDLRSHSDYILTYSEEWSAWHRQEYGIPVYTVGYPKLDKLFGNLKKDGTVLYSPTHQHKKDVYSGHQTDDGFPLDDIRDFCLSVGYRDFIYRQHPAFTKNELTLLEAFEKASLVISDYSSVGLEALVLNIPTILIGNTKWRDTSYDHISSRATDAAAERVYDWDSFKRAVETFHMNPDHLEKYRLEHSKRLCEYQGTAAKRTVDILESLL